MMQRTERVTPMKEISGWVSVVGKSFDAVDRSMLTPERYVRDGLALTSYLRDRFDEEKIYAVGESWGSALGIMMVQGEPQSFHAFIGTG